MTELNIYRGIHQSSTNVILTHQLNNYWPIAVKSSILYRFRERLQLNIFNNVAHSNFKSLIYIYDNWKQAGFWLLARVTILTFLIGADRGVKAKFK